MMKISQIYKIILPVAVALLIALLPAPTGLPQHAWYFFAIFSAVVVALIVEPPLPTAAIGFIAITVIAVLAPFTLYSPAELAKPGFNYTKGAINWALSGYGSSVVWLVFSAFMFALGYEKSGLGKRIALLLVRAMGHRTLFLGYAVAASDLILAPFTPSNTARSAGTVFPIVRVLPSLYGSEPNSPTSRYIGTYIMLTAIATTCVTSSLFMTALTPNILALKFIKTAGGGDISWMQWFMAAAPACIPLFFLTPLVLYFLCPPSIKKSDKAPIWAAEELTKMGRFSRNEAILSVLVIGAVGLWMWGEHYIDPTTVALLVISLMLVTGVIKFDDILNHHDAWKTLVLFSALVTLSEGLTKTGFIAWFGQFISTHLNGFPPAQAVIVIVVIYFLAHYMFASITSHAIALMPIMLVVGASIPGVPILGLGMLLALTHGLMGILTPYATGPAPVYYGSGYIPTRTYWTVGAVMGAIFLVTLITLSGSFVFRL